MRVSGVNGTMTRWTMTIALGASVAACQSGETPSGQETQAAPASSDSAAHTTSTSLAEHSKEKSIIRSDIEPNPSMTPELEPISLSIPFPDKDTKLDEAGIAMLKDLMASLPFQAGGPITLWGHSDSAGSDEANLAASRRRAEAVSAYLVAKGATVDRIMIIAMGEARPIAPNRKLDGTDDPEGRSKNRRVEIRVGLPPSSPAEASKAAAGAQLAD